MTTIYSCCCLNCWKMWKTAVKPKRCPKCKSIKFDTQIEKEWETK